MDKKKVTARQENSIRRDERRKVRKKKRARGTLYTMLAGLIAFLLSIFSGFFGLDPVGFYGDGSGSHSIVRRNEEIREEAVEPVEMADEEDGTTRIVVEGESYIYNGKTYDLEALVMVLDGMEDTDAIEVVDKLAAIKAFEDLEQQLLDRGIAYNIIESYE